MVRAPAQAALAALVFLLPLSPWLSPMQTRLWSGHRTLVVRDDGAAAGRMEAVVAAFGPGVVSALTATADFWDFTGIERVPYAGLDQRLDPMDPRRDPYIDAAAGFFRASYREAEWRVAYLPADAHGLAQFVRLARAIGFPLRGEWRLVEFDLLEKALSMVAVFGIAVLLALSLDEARRRTLVFMILGALAWVPSVLSGGAARLALCLALTVAWFPLVRSGMHRKRGDKAFHEQDRNRLFLYAGAAGIGTVVSLLFEGFSLPLLSGLVSPVAVCLLLNTGLPPFLQPRLFEPIPIVRLSADHRRTRSVAFFLSVLSVALTLLATLARGMDLPTPIEIHGARRFSWESLARLNAHLETRRLPDYSDLVTHVAFQETVAFGRPWRLPLPDEGVYAREFLLDSATMAMAARERRVKSFDAVWLSSVRERSMPGSLEALLYAQGRPVAVALRGAGHGILKEMPLLLFAVLALLALHGKDFGFRLLIRSIVPRFNGAARRNQVP
jgi:hypothetical protein